MAPFSVSVPPATVNPVVMPVAKPLPSEMAPERKSTTIVQDDQDGRGAGVVIPRGVAQTGDRACAVQCADSLIEAAEIERAVGIHRHGRIRAEMHFRRRLTASQRQHWWCRRQSCRTRIRIRAAEHDGARCRCAADDVDRAAARQSVVADIAGQRESLAVGVDRAAEGQGLPIGHNLFRRCHR